MSYDNTNSGALFKNEKKASDRHPDYTGSWTDANGVEHWLSAWIKTSAGGKQYMSLSATAKDQMSPAPAAAPKPASTMDFESDVPF